MKAKQILDRLRTVRQKMILFVEDEILHAGGVVDEAVMVDRLSELVSGEEIQERVEDAFQLREAAKKEASDLAEVIADLQMQKRAYERIAAVADGYATSLLLGLEAADPHGDDIRFALSTGPVVSLRRYQHVEGPLDAGLWPEEFRQISFKADKRAALDALKKGKTIPGVVLVEEARVSYTRGRKASGEEG